MAEENPQIQFKLTDLRIVFVDSTDIAQSKIKIFFLNRQIGIDSE